MSEITEEVLKLRAMLASASEMTTEASLLRAAIKALMGENQVQTVEQSEKKKRGRPKYRLNIPGLATLITEYLEKNGPCTAEKIFEALREAGELDQNKELAHVEFQLKKQTSTYTMLPSGKWWLKNKKIGVVG